jgi:hypothetical protein
MVSRSYRPLLKLLVRSTLLFCLFIFFISIYRNETEKAREISPSMDQPRQDLSLLFIGISSKAENHPLRSVQRDIFFNIGRKRVIFKFLVEVTPDMALDRKSLLDFELERFNDILFIYHDPKEDEKARFFKRIYQEGVDFKYVLHSTDDVYLNLENIKGALEMESNSLYYGREDKETGNMDDHWYSQI